MTQAVAAVIEDTLRPWFNGRILPVTERIAERWGILAVVTRNVRDFDDLSVGVFNPWSAA